MDKRIFINIFCLIFFLFCLAGIGIYNYFIARLSPDWAAEYWVLNSLMLFTSAGFTFFLFRFLRREALRAEDQKQGKEVQHQQYRKLFEENPNPMWVFDKETLAFLAVNQAAD